jgi:endonuclease/exonuclease/phosphatase family metal-dependent hydrolase
MRSARCLAPAALLVGAACSMWFHTGFEDVEAAVRYTASAPSPAPPPTGRIKVMTWNVKFGGARLRFFYECDGSRTLMTEDEVRGNVAAIVDRIRAFDPDVLLLQEVDTGHSKRVAYLDEVQMILDGTSLNHGAYAADWKADYVPSDGIGPVDSGNAVLSRWPIAEARRIALALSSEQSDLERTFYLKHNVLETRIEVPGLGDLWVLCTHAESGKEYGTKKSHIDEFQALMDGHRDLGRRVVGGGDLNEIPPTSPERCCYPEDEGCTEAYFSPDDYRGEETWLDGLYSGYAPDVTPAAFGADPGPWYSFVGDERFPLNRKLDHLFTNGRWLDSATLQDAVLLSDHVPVVAELEVP